MNGHVSAEETVHNASKDRLSSKPLRFCVRPSIFGGFLKFRLKNHIYFCFAFSFIITDCPFSMIDTELSLEIEFHLVNVSPLYT